MGLEKPMQADTPPVSFNKAQWHYADVDMAQIQNVMRRHDISEIVARILLTRGIPTDNIETFLNPTLKTHLPNPFVLKGMEEMAEEVAQAIIAGKKLSIFGDFDVDGATSSAVLYRFLKAAGIDAEIYIPDRLEEGYGPNITAFQKLKDNGADWVFVLDCGITAFDVIEKGRDIGLNIVIVDHHEAEEKLPKANHIINPKRKDDESGLDMLAAVGVTFMTCIAINKTLRDKNFWSDDRPEPNLIGWLDLVCLGTVCDMVPLQNINRLFVKQGLKIMDLLQNTGIRALAKVSGSYPPFNSKDLGFALGPRINAGGRIHKSDLGAKLLATDDMEEAENIAWLLNDCNDKRRDIQNQMEDEAAIKVENEGLHNASAIVVSDENWHPGLSGLVAGKLKDKYDKPAAVITFTKTGEGVLEGRGSGRSIAGVHMAQAFIDARNEGLLVKGGGHAMAAGFTIEPDKISAFTEFLCNHVESQKAQGLPSVTYDVDSIITAQGASLNILKTLINNLGPFGCDFEEPLFAFHNVRLHSVDVLKEKHIRAQIGDWEGGARLKAMAFGAAQTNMGQAMLTQGKQSFDILGRLKLNQWQGRESVEIHIEDAMFSANNSFK